MPLNNEDLECEAMKELGWPDCFTDRYPMLAHEIDDGSKTKLCMECAVALHKANKELKATLFTESRTDFDTKLGNRRYLSEQIEEFKEAGVPFAVIQGDIKKVRETNNNLGNGKGDELISATADVLQGRTDIEEDDNITKPDITLRLDEKTEDFASRTGGDEFAILMSLEPRETEEEELTEMDRVMAAINRHMRNFLRNGQIQKIDQKLYEEVGEHVGIRFNAAIGGAGDNVWTLLDRTSTKPDCLLETPD